MNRIALTKKQMDTLINAGLDVSDASLVYMGKGQFNLNKNEKYIDTIIKCKLGFYKYTLEDIYKRIDDIITLDYFLVITPVCIQLQYIKNDDIYHAESTANDDMLEAAYNMLLWCLKNILKREIKQ